MVKVNLRLDGQVAIVTGASRRQGIGAAVCRALAAQGADVLFTYWQAYDRTKPYGADEDGPQALERAIQELGVHAVALEADLTAAGTPTQVLNITEDRLGPPSILVNNAVHSVRASYETMDVTELDTHYAVNVRALAMLSIEFARRFQAGNGGRIINLTSGQSVAPMPDQLPYATTKGAVEAFTRSLAAGVAARGITVNAIDPGGTDTGWMSEELKSAILRQSAFGRLGQPDDAARLIVFLASPAGAWITGQVIHSRGA